MNSQQENTDPRLLEILRREGVLINVSVRYWRGRKKLTPEDLGLDPAQVSDRLISLGHKRLLPQEATRTLALIESRAHATVEANTFPFLGGLAHFLPNAKLEEVHGRLKELENEFWEARKDFLSQYGLMRENAMTEWRAMADKLPGDSERLLATVRSAFPPPEKLRDRFGFAIHLFQIALPENLQEETVRMGDQIALQRSRREAAAQASKRIHQEVESFVSESVTALREETARLCEEMLTSIRTSETGVHQKTLNRLIHFIDRFREMNFADDRRMEEELTRVRRELLSRSAEEYRANPHARRNLTEGLSHLAGHARELAQSDTSEVVERFGQMGRRKFHFAA